MVDICTFQGRDFAVVQLDEGQQRMDSLLGIETDERVEIVQLQMTISIGPVD
jgi:hypothetical protein